MTELLNVDCMDYMRGLPDNAFELAIVDPPYGININPNAGRRKGAKCAKRHKFAGGDKSIPSADYFDELRRVSVNQVIWGGNFMTEHLKPSPCWLVWDKKQPEGVIYAQVELAWTSFVSSPKKFTQYFDRAHQQGRIHPTQKPIRLYEWIMMRYAKEGDRILDTHLGSGSSAIAAHNLGFEFVGCELDTDYFNAAQKRLKLHQSQLRIPMH